MILKYLQIVSISSPTLRVATSAAASQNTRTRRWGSSPSTWPSSSMVNQDYSLLLFRHNDLFSDFCPSNFMFVTPNGGLVPDKLQAAVELQEFDENPGLLVLSEKIKWEEFSEMIQDGCYSEVLVLEGENRVVIENRSFDCVILVKDIVVETLTNKDFSQKLSKVNISKHLSGVSLECINIANNVRTEPKEGSNLLNNRLKNGDHNQSTKDYLEKSEPANSRKSTRTALRQFYAVVHQKYPEEKRLIADLPEDLLAQYLEDFFRLVMKENGGCYNASTLGTYHSAIARLILRERKINIKINEKFSLVTKTLARRQRECAEEGEIPGKHASKAVPLEVMAEAIKLGVIGWEAPKPLVTLVIKNLSSGFGTRSRTEPYQMTNSDVVLGPVREDGVYAYLELSERVTKTRTGNRGQGITIGSRNT